MHKIACGYRIPEEAAKVVAGRAEFVWPDNTAVEGVNAVKSVSSVKYVNIAGQVSANPFSGMNVVITNYTDGTQSVAKVIK